MADLIRAGDWASTPLGTVADWPQSLRTAVDLMLATATPVSVLWGPERIQLYNDAYIPVAGNRHPAALGRPVAETWAEAYDVFLRSPLDRAYAGEAVVLDQQPVLLRDAAGELEERVFSASFSPIRDGTGAVAGVFHPLVEVWGRRAVERELKAERDRSRAFLDNLGDGFVVLDRDFRVIEINAEGLRLDGRPREEIVGRSHWEVFPASVGSPVEAAYRRALAERVPVELEHRYIDPALGYDVWLDIRAYPSEGGLAIFYRNVSARKRDEEALRRRSEQLQGLAEVAQRVTRVPALEAKLDEVTRAATRIVGAHQGVVSLTRGPDWSQAINAVALTDKYAGWKDYDQMPGGDGIYAWLCEENRPARFTQAELEAHPRWRGFGPHAGNHPPMRGWLAAPLMGRDGRNLGLIQLSDKDDGGEFDEADKAMLVQLAQLASAAVEQAQAEEEVQEERTRLKLATAAGQIGIWDWDIDTDTITASEHARAIFGAPEQPSFTPQEVFGVIHPEDRDRVVALSQRALDPKVRSHELYEYRIQRPDGTVRWVLAQGEAAFESRDGRPAPVRYFGTIQDITARREAEQAERQAAQRLRLAVDAGRLAVWDLDVATNTVTGSPELSLLLGFPDGQPIDADAARLRYCPGEYERVSAEHAAAMARGQTSYDAEFRYRHPDLGVRWLRMRYDLVFDAEGRPIRVIGVMSDETGRKEAEVELRESETRFRAAVDAVQGVLWTNDADGRMQGEQPGWAALTGQSFEDYQGYGWTAAVHPEDAEPTVAAWTEAVAERRPFLFEHRVRRHDGQWRLFSVRAIPAVAPTGEIREWVGVHTDITELRTREAELRELNETLEARVEQAVAERDRTWNNARDLLLVVGTDGVFRAVNPAWTAVLGWSAAELVGRSLLDFIHPDDHPSSQGALATASARELPTYENRYRHKDGSYRTISWVAAPEGELIYASGRDVSAEKERQAELESAQEALRQAQKMEAVGQLTGGLAHDFNNLLAGISGSLDLMGTRLSQGRIGEVERYILAAQGAARRAAALTHRLLAFSRRQTLDPKPTDVNRLVAGMEDLIRRTVGPAIAVEVVGASGLWPTLVDPPQLENALLNLCINARDAMPDGGRITVETANKWLDRAAARRHDLPEGQYLSLCVTDTGTGMSPDVQARAFDPFFTTKPIGEGTGLGLSMIYGFAKQSGGQVRIYSEPGQGTTVCIYLPRHLGQEPADAAEGRSEARARSEGGETVLVVDDEPTVRMLVTDVLEELGYAVLEAADSVEGLKVLRSDARIDLLVTDVGLPGGMNGRQMADAGREVRPDLQVLFITGYAENAALGHGQLAPGMAVMTKPFAMDHLAARIGEMIRQAKGAG